MSVDPSHVCSYEVIVPHPSVLKVNMVWSTRLACGQRGYFNNCIVLFNPRLSMRSLLLFRPSHHKSPKSVRPRVKPLRGRSHTCLVLNEYVSLTKDTSGCLLWVNIIDLYLYYILTILKKNANNKCCINKHKKYELF